VGKLTWWDHFLWWLGFSICHQQQERMLHYGSKPLFVCARDTGLFVGLFTTMALLFLFARRFRNLPPSFYLLTLAGFAFFLWDSITSYLGSRESSNLMRLLSGFSCGSGLALPLAFRVGLPALGPGEEGGRSLGLARTSAILIASCVAMTAFLWRSEGLFRLAQAYLFLSLVGSLTMLNFLLLLTFRDRKAKTPDGRGGSLPRPRRLMMGRGLTIVAAVGMAALELSAGHVLHSLALSG